ncbi:MAG: adenylate/guanylate cyclase domain-containing protein [Deltaproteobacteria bacterium]|nr:adenylate/guanylate cyclase domain-containing protein [Candidatus Anaeroferrophillacea bacterium]
MTTLSHIEHDQRQSLLNREFTRLHREVSERVAELSAVCALQEELARGFADDPAALMQRLLNLVLLHLQADLVVWMPPAAPDADDPPFAITAAPGIPIPDAAVPPPSATEGMPASPTTYGGPSCCCRHYPVEAAGRPAGTLVIGHRRADFFTPARERFAALLRQQLQNAILLQRLAGERERENRRRLELRRYFSTDIAAAIEAGEQPGVDLSGRRLTVAILCADIRGFSRLVEQRGENDAVALLNRFYRLATEVIFAHHGTIDKFAGDGLLAVFGAPVQRPDDLARAIAAAVSLQRQWQSVKPPPALEPTAAGGNPHPEIAVALHWGPVIAGRLGTDELLTYTVIGDPVNTCHRLVSLAPPQSIIASREMITAADAGHDSAGEDAAGRNAAGEDDDGRVVWKPFRTAEPLRGMDKCIDLFRATWD